jgi:hypothetical protein
MILRNVFLWAECTDARGAAIGPRNLPLPNAPSSWWQTTTPEDVANMLADADMAPLREAMTPAERDKAAVALAAQRHDLAQRVINAVGTTPLGSMAYEIDEQRLIYAPFLKGERNDVSPDLVIEKFSSIGRHDFENLQSAESVEPEDRRRILEAVATLRRLLPHAVQSYSQRGQEKSAKEYAGLLSAISDFHPSPRKDTLWHRCACSLSAIYVFELSPPSGWWRDGVPICFIQQALRWVGFPSTIERSAIAKVVKVGEKRMQAKLDARAKLDATK